MSQEHEDDRILHFVVVERPKDVFQLVNDYVEHIYELRKRDNFKDHLEELVYLLIDEVRDLVADELILEQLMRCGEMLSKKEYYD